MLVDQIISVLDRLQVIVQTHLALLKHALLQLQIIEVGLAIFLLLDVPLHLLFFNLALDSLHLHALVLLLDF